MKKLYIPKCFYLSEEDNIDIMEDNDYKEEIYNTLKAGKNLGYNLTLNDAIALNGLINEVFCSSCLGGITEDTVNIALKELNCHLETKKYVILLLEDNSILIEHIKSHSIELITPIDIQNLKPNPKLYSAKVIIALNVCENSCMNSIDVIKGNLLHENSYRDILKSFPIMDNTISYAFKINEDLSIEYRKILLNESISDNEFTLVYDNRTRNIIYDDSDPLFKSIDK